MSGLTQYLQLWAQHRDMVESHSPRALNALRQEAARLLADRPLPRQGSACYPATDLDGLLAPDYGLNIARIPMEVDPSASFQCEVPRLSTWLFFMANDSFRCAQSTKGLLPEGVEVTSLSEYARRDPEFIEGHYGKLADLDNPLAALDTLFCQDGVVIRIHAGVKAEKPIQIVGILHALVPFMAVRRILIVMEEGSEATVLCCDHTQVPEVKLANLQTVEIFAGRNSSLDFYELEESTPATTRLSTLWLRQEEGSRVLLDGVTLYNGTTRNEYHTRFAGPHASLRLLGMAIEDSDSRQETYSRIVHEATDCKTDELVKYIVEDRAAGSFAGRIVVQPGAMHTEAYQSNRNLVGSDSARMYSKPELEIYNDDVKCSHGSATGQLDSMQLFYMRTRGLSQAEARLLLKQAFMADVIDAIALPSLRDRLRHLVEMRFNGTLGTGCDGCRSCALHDE